jgi:benzoyl-CoA reductase/2-hydroxyglutaryl-CoA dehydratase subunit BcrC/BadD/HgdB
MGKRLRATESLKRLIKNYYDEFFQASRSGKPVAWLNVGVPCEIFYAMEVFPFYPENYGAMCGAQKVTPELSQIAEYEGFTNDICSYARANIGSLIAKKGPVGELPLPTIQVETTNSCIMIMTWWRAIEKLYNIPTFVIDAPLVKFESEGYHLDYMESELKRMINFVEEKTGKKIDEEKFHEIVKISNEGKRLWAEILELRANVPCPMNAGDIFTHMFPMVALRGTPQYVEHLKFLRDELYERIQNKDFPVSDERVRLLWDNLPIWFDLRLFDELEQYGIIFVIDTYTQAWGPRFMGIVDESNPIRSFGYYLGSGFLNVQIERRYKLMEELIKQYKVDGVVFHSDRSCKPYSLVQPELSKLIREKLNVPTLIIESDHNDQSGYNRNSVIERMKDFAQMIISGRQ